MQPRARQQHLALIVASLSGEFDVDPETLLSEAATTYDDLCATSRVESFIPILTLRRCRQRLQRRP